MRKLLFGLFLLCFAQLASAQLSTIKGKVVDTLDRKTLTNAVVTFLHKKDSTLARFVRSDKNGQFFVKDMAPGKYVILVTYPKFADFAEEVEVKPGKDLNLATIPLTLKAKLLDAVVIRTGGSIRIKGDTTEFVADSFKVREGATVEELLKKLPGFQVNSKGEITAQGQRVQKVLVDGEEFFGDDPTMATQNISAKAVDRVQVFESKTDRQQMTGISTGTEGKTVNIKLKEDQKKGSFGKGHVGSNFDNLVDAKVLFNRFVGKKKISFYGTKTDLSTGSLNWEDRQKLGMENDLEYDEISGYYYSFSSGDDFNDWSLRGLPHAYTGGALFSNKWNQDKNNLNTSYRYNRLGTVNDASTLTQNILANSITYRNRYQTTDGLNQQHSINAKYEWKPDSSNTFKITTLGNYKITDVLSNIRSEFLNDARQYTNRSIQFRENHTERKQSDNQLSYKHTFKKTGRLLMLSARFGLVEDDQNGIIKTNTDFFKGGAVDSVDIADQQKLTEGKSVTMGSKLTYNEPLSSLWNLVVDYGYNVNNAASHRNTYNKDNSGKYGVLDTTFSNNFDLDATSHSSMLVLRYMGKKLRTSFGSGVSSVRLKLMDLDHNRENVYDFLNLTPQFTTAYSFTAQSRLSLNYRGTTRQPTIDQLQPIRDNADRLNIFIGNPDLKVGFNHNLNLSYNTYKTLSQMWMYASVNYNIPVNAITFYNTIDLATGAQTYTPVNINGNRNWSMWASMNKDGGEKKLHYGISMNANGGKNYNYVSQNKNGTVTQEKNLTEFLNSDFSVSAGYNNPDKFTLELRPNIGYNKSVSSLNATLNSDYWNYGGNADLFLMLPGKLELSSNCYFNLRQKLAAFTGNPSQINWNASMAKKVFKDKSGKIIFLVNDILEQNIGFNRNISSNFISEDRYSRLSRYFLLKFEWSFNKMPGQTK